MASTVLPIALPDELRRRIEKLAAEDETRASEFVSTALNDALDYQEKVRAMIARGIADVEAGRTISHEEMMERIKKKLATFPDD